MVLNKMLNPQVDVPMIVATRRCLAPESSFVQRAHRLLVELRRAFILVRGNHHHGPGPSARAIKEAFLLAKNFHYSDMEQEQPTG